MRYLLLIILAIFIFFKPFFLEGKLPIPSDALVGMYHPWRDALSDKYPNGIPFKNFLITDPIRQQIPWKWLVMKQPASSRGEWSNGTIPLWNDYSFSGTPLLANFQSGVFYPLNLFFFLISDFKIAWSGLILLQMILGGFFMYLFLRNLSLKPLFSVFGAITWIFSGFWIAWLEWGNILHTALWLPLITFTIDKIYNNYNRYKNYIYYFVFLFSLLCSFFAGHLQTFFYLWVFAAIYWFYRRLSIKLFLALNSIFLILSSAQWYPTLQFILQSGRGMDVSNALTRNDWFLPWQHLIQFIAPDFFGNPATLNYWGVWNYGEMIGYVGIAGLILAIYAIITLFKNNREIKFFTICLAFTFLFLLPTPIAKLPFLMNIPFLATAQPTRLIFLVDFLLSILAAYGMEQLLNYSFSKRKLLMILFGCGVTLLVLWLIAITGNLLVAKNNLKLPTGVFMLTAAIMFFLMRVKSQRARGIFIIILMVISFADQLRFANKFTPFTNPEYFYPTTKTIDFLQKDKSDFRIMAVDDRIMPPNVSIVYGLKDIAGYDPLYLKSYAEKINIMEDRQQGSGFNRIITPKNYNSPLIDELRVKYILSLDDIQSPKLIKVFQEGETRVYLNKNF